MSVMEAGGMTLVSEVLKVTHQVLALWDWLPASLWSAHIAFCSIGEPFPFLHLEFECQLGVLKRVLDGELLLPVQHLDIG